MKPLQLCLVAAALMVAIYHYAGNQQSSVPNTVAPVLSKSTTQELFIHKITNKPFIDAAEDAAFAISERNFRVTNTLRIGNAVRERGREDFAEYDVILFCNIQFAERMLELDPSYVNFCPGQIAVWEQDGQVHISAPLVPEHDHLEELTEIVTTINELVIESVEFAAEEWQDVTD